MHAMTGQSTWGKLRALWWRVAGLAFTRVGAAGAALLSTLVLSNLMGAAQFGIYAVFINILLVLSTFGKWGWDGASVRFVAAHLSDGHAPSAKAFSGHALKRVLVLSGITALAVLVVTAGLWIADAPLQVPLWLFAAAALVLPLVVVSFLAQGTLRGQGLQLQAELYEGILKPLLLVGLIGAVLLLLPHSLTASVAVVAYGVVSLFAAGIGWWQARKPWRRVAAAELHALPVADWRAATAAHGLVNFCQTFIGKMPVIVAGLMLPPAQAALLAVAIRLSETLQLGMTAVGLAVAPNLAAHAHQRRTEQLAAAMREARKVSLFMALAGGAVIALFARPLLSLFGAEFTAAVASLLVLTAAQVLNAAFGPVGYLATMSGQQAAAARVCCIVAALSLPLLVAAGAIGSSYYLALAYAVTMLLQSALLWRVTRRVLAAPPVS
jgi:O-antigen/teichoic acid export membrane protein